ncbi:MAG: hypothetical protein ACKV22_26920 [Bryobacteraceae bacterium]
MSLGVERYFGVKERRSYGHFPASAFRGPWLALLRYHPLKALDFFQRVFNHCSHRYVNPLFREPLEPAWQIEITLADGTNKAQWGNARLWNLYRGTSVGPCLLQSKLMALERWLFDYATAHPDTLDRLLLQILAQTESAMISAVVASVATAYPQHSGDTLLSLLSSLEYVRLDLARRVAEAHATTMSDFMPSRLVNHELYEEERRGANRLPHRAKHLEDAALSLQLGPLAPKVQALIDQHKASLTSRKHQDDETKTLRLALHRMDLRQYTATKVEESKPAPPSPEESSSAPNLLVRLDPIDPEPDVKAMVDQSTKRHAVLNRGLGVFNWAYSTFNREAPPIDDPALWRAFLDQEMNPPPTQDTLDDDFMAEVVRGGPSMLAAVCVRDHWEEMAPAQRQWCVDRISTEVLAAADQWAHIDRMQRHTMSPDRACAWSLCLLVAKQLTEEDRSRVEAAFANGLSHPTNEVRWHIAWGIANNISYFDQEFVSRCVNALALETTLIQRERRANEALPRPQREKLQQGESTRAAVFVRSRFWETDGIPETAYDEFDAEDWIGTETSTYILTILAADPSHPLAALMFTRASELLVKRWDDHRHGHESQHEHRNYEAETALGDCIERFVMRSSFESAKAVLDPILKSIDSQPRKIHSIIQGLTVIEDREPNTDHYWRLWLLFAGAVKSASWIEALDNEHPLGDAVISAIFLTNDWKKTTRHWRSLEGHAHHVHELFESLPPSWCVLDSYVRFLYYIGEQSLPHSLIRIANKLRSGDARSLLSDTNTVFVLEVLLQRHVYGRPLELKQDMLLRESVLSVLDKLVEAGSAASYRMRDDFVTPISR